MTALPRLPQEQYGGAMVLSGAEVRQAARFQTRFTDAHTGRSPFFTLVFQMNAQQQVEPLAFQVRCIGSACHVLRTRVSGFEPASLKFLAERLHSNFVPILLRF